MDGGGNAKRSGNLYPIFNNANPNTNFTPGAAGYFPSYSAVQAEQKTFTVNLGVNFQFTDPSISLTSGSFSFGTYLNGSTLIGNLQIVRFTSSYNAGGTSAGAVTTLGNVTADGNTFDFQTSDNTFTGPFSINGGGSVGAGQTITVAVYTWKVSGVSHTGLLPQSVSAPIAGISTVASLNPTWIQTISSAVTVPPSSINTSNQLISYTTPATSFGPSDTAVFKFRQDGMSSANYTASISVSAAASSDNSLTAGTITIGQGGYPYASPTVGGSFIQSITTPTSFESIITLNSSLSQYLNYQYVPYFVSASDTYSSSLYSRYGNINVPFYPQFGDKIILSDYSGLTQNVDVLSTSVIGGAASVTVVPAILSNWVTNPNLILNVLILRRYNDEQNVILTFNKNPGQTSNGFIIPNTINPNVTQNINTLQAAVQSQLLTTQVGVTATG
jgi:hypothetical protein